MINRRVSSVERHSTASNGNGANGGNFFSSSQAGQFLYSRSISTPSPSLPKAIPVLRGTRTRSVFGQSLSVDGDIPHGSAPVTFNRYINVNCNVGATQEHGSSPTSWYARLSSSLKKSVLRRSTSTRESPQKRRNGAIHRKSVIILVFWTHLISLCIYYRIIESSMGHKSTKTLWAPQLASYYNLVT